MIMLASEITEQDPVPLGLMDIGVRRNAFGRQVDSFEQPLEISPLAPEPYHCIFIRAPVVIRVGPPVDVLASLDDGRPVAVQQGNLLATAFHPEPHPGYPGSPVFPPAWPKAIPSPRLYNENRFLWTGQPFRHSREGGNPCIRTLGDWYTQDARIPAKAGMTGMRRSDIGDGA